MRWFLLLLVTLGIAAVGLGYVRVPLLDRIPWPVSPETKKAAAANLTSSRALAQRVLQPLDSDQIVSTAEARRILANLRTRVEAQQKNPVTTRELQALNVIEQAIAERESVIVKLNTKAGSTTLDAVPGDWHVAGHPEKKVDPTAINRKWRSSFWTQTILSQWNNRCATYRATIDSLLAQAGPSKPPAK